MQSGSSLALIATQGAAPIPLAWLRKRCPRFPCGALYRMRVSGTVTLPSLVHVDGCAHGSYKRASRHSRQSRLLRHPPSLGLFPSCKRNRCAHPRELRPTLSHNDLGACGLSFRRLLSVEPSKHLVLRALEWLCGITKVGSWDGVLLEVFAQYLTHSSDLQR